MCVRVYQVLDTVNCIRERKYVFHPKTPIRYTDVSFAQGYTGPLAEPERQDELSKRLLAGAKIWDGGGRGVPLTIRGFGACFPDASSLGLYGASLTNTEDAWRYSLPILAAIRAPRTLGDRDAWARGIPGTKLCVGAP